MSGSGFVGFVGFSRGDMVAGLKAYMLTCPDIPSYSAEDLSTLNPEP